MVSLGVVREGGEGASWVVGNVSADTLQTLPLWQLVQGT